MTPEVIILFSIIISLSYHVIVYIQTKSNFNKDKNRRREILNEKLPVKLPFVSILKPIKGIDDGLEENIKSFLEIDYPEYEIIFGFHSEDDPALPIIEKIVKQHPEVITKIIVDSSEIGLNPKINNLNNIYPFSLGDLILVSDSNTRANKNLLHEMVAEILDDDVGLVSASIRGTGAKNTFALMENIHLNSFINGIIQSANSVAGIQITVGKAILIKRKVLEMIGGFSVFKFYLAEDHLMGLEIKRQGYKVLPSTVIIDTINENWSLQKFINRHRRWNLMRANIDLKFYILEFLTYTSTLSLILYLVNPTLIPISIASVFLKISIDYLTTRIIISNFKWYHFIHIPVKDIIMAILWFLPFLYNKISWRENRLKVLRNSQLMPVS